MRFTEPLTAFDVTTPASWFGRCEKSMTIVRSLATVVIDNCTGPQHMSHAAANINLVNAQTFCLFLVLRRRRAAIQIQFITVTPLTLC